MNNWIENAKSITNKGIAGICPKCGSVNTDYEYVTVEPPNGYLSIWCDDCKARAAIDCIVPTESARKTA